MAGQFSDALHGSRCRRVRARASGSGTCTSAGHLGGTGTAQLTAWMGVECWMPHSPPVQPHRHGGRSSSLSTTRWMATRSAQSSTGNKAMAAFVLAFLHCEHRQSVSSSSRTASVSKIVGDCLIEATKFVILWGRKKKEVF